MAASFLATKSPQFLRAKLIAERTQWVVWSPVGIGTGILSYFGMQTEPSGWIGLIGLLCSFISLISLRIFKSEHFGAYCLVLMSFTLCLGFSAAQLRTYSVGTYLFHYPSRVQTIEGEIKKIEQMPKSLRLTLQNVTLAPIKLKHPLGRVRINFKGKNLQERRDFIPGQKVKFKGVLLPPNAPVAPGAYDFRKKAFFEKISAVGYGITFPEINKDYGPQGIKEKLITELTRMRHSLTKYLKITIGGDSGAIAAALITGDRSGISEELREDFANSGLAHILAISGLHLSIVAGLVFLVFRKGLSFIPWLTLRYPIKKWAAAFAIILTFFYLVICDFAIPAQRSFMMTAIILVAVITDRTAITLRNVALAAIVILLVLPESIISPSFQMSFSAVIALVSGYEILKKPLEHWRTTYRQWWQTLLFYLFGITFSTILATIATTPYIVYTFNRFTLHALPANIICIPLLSFIIMPSLVLYLVISSFSSASYLALFLQKIIGFMTEIAHTISSWPGSTLLVPSIPSHILLIFTLSFLWICLWKTSWRWWGGGGMIIAFILTSFSPKPDIFMAGDKNLICLLDVEGKGWVNSLQAGRFARENWLKMVALQDVQKFSEDLEEQPVGIHITRKSYLISKNGKTVMILKDSQEKDFQDIKSDLEIRPSVKEVTDSSTLITGYELKMKGGHLIWMTKSGVKVRTVSDDVGTRPWSLKIKE
ncbi:MAG: ComEC/Rec2 family competence protein [Candidatus Paracaedimonas acanthamoebae]|uniref:ComEC/Rec2 family competence protein n=1 Tax=Candidatus Paracaedimonas acanthamoebae TaxID=244581 RepID=A0A8J7TTB8_9PROT|nr:ComEC/Rec2 family competence protein [Candidatus Paracaedimonas acanthamoebae]